MRIYKSCISNIVNYCDFAILRYIIYGLSIELVDYIRSKIYNYIFGNMYS